VNDQWKLEAGVLTRTPFAREPRVYRFPNCSTYLLERLGSAIADGDRPKMRRLFKLATATELSAAKPVAQAPRLLSTYTRRAVSYLWQPRLPKDQFAVAYGPPGSRKTWLGCWLAAQCSNGTMTGKPEHAMFCVVEDRVEDCLLERMVGLGGDPAYLHMKEHLPHFDNGGIDQLRVDIVEHQLALAVFDPLTCFMSLRSEVRLSDQCRELHSLGEDNHCAILGIHHTTKASLMRGSQVLSDRLRSIMRVKEVAPDVSELFHEKCSYCPSAGTVYYTIDQETGQLQWVADWVPQEDLDDED
jgi:hypothetical protein